MEFKSNPTKYDQNKLISLSELFPRGFEGSLYRLTFKTARCTQKLLLSGLNGLVLGELLLSSKSKLCTENEGIQYSLNDE